MSRPDAAPDPLVTVRPTLADLEALRDGPHEYLLRVRRTHGSSVRVGWGRFRLYLLSHPAHVRGVLVSGHREFTKDTFQYRLLARVTGEGLLTMDGPPWLERRRREQPLFHRDAVERWEGRIVEATDRLLDEWDQAARTGEPRDVARDMLRLALDVVLGTLFPPGPRYDRPGILDATMEVLNHIITQARTLGVLRGWMPFATNRRFDAAIETLDGAILGAVAEHRRAGGGGDDLLSHLMRPGEGGEAPLSDRELRDEMLTMIIAGHETVASALAWAWWLLDRHPEVDDALSREGSIWASAVFDETLRLYPPAWIVTRTARKTVQLDGLEIPKGGLVVISPYVIQRDGGLWPEPDRFRPRRFLEDRDGEMPRHAYLPFGAGPHLCIGAHLGRLEARIVLSRAARRFRLRSIPESPPVVHPGVTLHPKDGLWMRVESRRG